MLLASRREKEEEEGKKERMLEDKEGRRFNRCG
jgi:hypothetical protein